MNIKKWFKKSINLLICDQTAIHMHTYTYILTYIHMADVTHVDLF